MTTYLWWALGTVGFLLVFATVTWCVDRCVERWRRYEADRTVIRSAIALAHRDARQQRRRRP